MSVNNIKYVPSREERTFEDKGKLIISKELQNQIGYLHYHVKPSVEWSGPLVYKVEAGDIDDPKSLVLRAEKLILMDIGSAGYTEYEFSAADDFMMDEMEKVYEAGLKLGQIHTHHNMATFFSGTDTKELHDNAPNYDFYLSLIVNYQNGGSWMAKIAVCAKEVTTGKTTTTSTWKTLKGLVTDKFKNDVKEEIEVLYLIEMEVELEVSEEFKNRFTEINTKKKTVVPHIPAHKPYTKHSAKWDQLVLDLDKKEKKGAGFSGVDINSLKDINEGIVKNFLAKSLSLDMLSESMLYDVLKKIENSDSVTKEIIFESFSDNFEKDVETFFNLKKSSDLMERVSELAISVLHSYRDWDLYKPLIEIFDIYDTTDFRVKQENNFFEY